jgi:hypothetical protein
MPQLHISNGFTKPLSGLGARTQFSQLSEKRVSKSVREEVLRPRYGKSNVKVSCAPRFDGKFWRGDCKINGRQEKFWISP